MSAGTAPTAQRDGGSARAPRPTGARAGTSSPPRWWLVVVVLTPLATALGLLWALATGGAASPDLVRDPGALVRYGLPVATLLRDLAMAMTLGGLVLAAGVVPARAPSWAPAARAAAVASGVWTVASLAVLVLTAANLSGTPLADPSFGAQLAIVATQITQGQALLVSTVVVALVATAAVGVRTPAGAGWTAALGALAIVPLALNAHSTGTSGHETAVTSWGLHVLGVAVWFGGLMALVAVARSTGAELPVVARRYSSLALVGFVLVVASGVANASLRVAGLADLLGTGYGLLVVAKATASVLLGFAGWVHRRSLLAAIDTRTAAGAGARGPFWRLVGGEVVLLGAVSGVAAALSLTPPPVPQELPPAPTPAELLTGEALPEPFRPSSLVTQWQTDVLWIAVALALAVAYGRGVARLRRRGDRWSVGRTVAFAIGLVVLVYMTSGAPAAYGRTVFSAHMVQHMVLSMLIPVLLVLGAPMTLALRSIPKRRDGSRGVREWLVVLTESRWLRVVSHPVVAAVLFAGSLIVFYYTPLFELALSTHVGHELMMVHFLGVGYLFANALVGIDPGPNRPSYPLRVVLLFATMAFHAFFGIAIISSETLLAGSWFSSTGWGIDALADQRTGGGIAWGIGEFPTLLLVVVVAVQWARSDEREQRRRDRTADRTGDAELVAYNAMLAERDRQGAPRR
ncbi:cytochrome c oxidase assembly protein [Pseudokineococcus marinus]|uniref:Bifunctional copper resistance protein CopD/cytochrome c oxidase assembly protein n=1 Tax=Pseudokineococcus marinus TaxID=351215 RepID=A0A849BMT8_9ACTN|nr:cytochrome c oxidase assembly protein [Pseudokineococcus marinus]NNH23971.1 bifunctional copper resistance protein CopD/cytochrome c oxidase assembly protein [Pseudokineococcus marinus]